MPTPMRNRQALSVAKKRTRSTSPITMRNGACRNTTTARSMKSSCSTAFRPACRGSRSCASARISAAPSTALCRKKSRATGRHKIERLMGDAGIVRNRAKIEGTVLSARAWLEAMEKGPGFSKAAVGFRRRPAEGQPLPLHAAGAGGNRNVARDVQGTGAARLQVLRADHRLRLHAGRRHGQRSSGDMPPPRAVQKPLRKNLP